MHAVSKFNPTARWAFHQKPKMNTVRRVLEVDPATCAIVVGPQLVAEAFSNALGSGLIKSYCSVVDACVEAARSQLVGLASHEQRQKELLKVLLELDATVAAQVATKKLREDGLYKRWLSLLLDADIAVSVDGKARVGLATASERPHIGSTADNAIRSLLQLQRKGALLMCTQYSTLLDRLAGTEPVLFNQQRKLEEWTRGERQGFLHLHGVFSSPETMVLSQVDYIPILKRQVASSTFPSIQDIFTRRLVIYVGYDDGFYNPLIPALQRVLSSEDHPHHSQPILLTAKPLCSLNSTFLQLPVSQCEMSHLDIAISIGVDKILGIGVCCMRFVALVY